MVTDSTNVRSQLTCSCELPDLDAESCDHWGTPCPGRCQPWISGASEWAKTSKHTHTCNDKKDGWHYLTVTGIFLRYLTSGFSPRRERSKKLWRSPYFMNGRMTIGLGKRPESASKHTPGRRRTKWFAGMRQCMEKAGGTFMVNGSILPSSLMTLGWLKSFMQAASFRNSSISLWEKLSTGDREGTYLCCCSDSISKFPSV